MALNKFKDGFKVYKQANYKVFTPLGLIISILLILIFASIHLFKFKILDFEINGDLINFLINFLLALISAIFTTSLFWIIGKNYGPQLTSIIVTNRILKILLTKGDAHYFEKLSSSERKISPGVVINKFINLLLAWLAVSAFLIGSLLPVFDFLINPSGDPATRINTFLTAGSNDLLPYIFKIIFVLFLTPILLIIVIPIPWMLNDSHLKSYSTGLRTNNFVGKLIQQRVASLFAIGGLVSLFLISPTLDLILALLSFIILFVALPVALVSFLYNLLFQIEYYDQFIKIIPVPFGVTQVLFEKKEFGESQVKKEVNSSEIDEPKVINDNQEEKPNLDPSNDESETK